MEHPTSMKWVAFAVVVLFIGLAFAPSLHANLSTEDELVEVTTEFCGLDRGEHKVRLTQQEVEELGILFDTIRERLDKAESREETIEIFNEAIIELDKYGLLGGLSIEQAQKLVTDGFQNQRVKNLFEKLKNRNYRILDENENYFCLIMGETTSTWFLSLLYRIVESIYDYLKEHNSFFALYILFFVVWPLWIINIFKPLFIGSYVVYAYEYTEGWVWTLGLNGVVTWNGTLWGQITTPSHAHVATIGFTGLKILLNFQNETNYYLGSATYVKIEEL